METKENNIYYDRSKEPIILSKPLIDLFLKQKEAGNLIALYVFYYYTAKWQKTNTPKATTNYTAKGLHWSETKVRKIKNILKNFNLIEDIVSKEKGRIKGHYIHLVYIESKNTLDNILNNFHTVENTQCEKSHSVENLETNTLSNNNINTLNTNNKIIVSKDTIYIPTEYLLCIDKIIEHWNKFPNCTKHKKGTKLYETLKKQFFNLLSGKPLLNTKENNPTKPLQDFFKKYNIPQNLYTKKWTEKEIIKLLRKISKSESDKKLSLPNIMWNQFAQRNNGFSLFLFEASKSNISWQYISLAIQLSNIVKPDLCKSKQLEWAKEFQFLIEQDKKDIKEVTELLQWYASNKDDIYTPIADDAMEFCEKYEKIKRAKERKLKKNLYNKPKNGSRYFDDVNKEYTDYDKNTFIEKNGKLIKIK